MGTADGSVRPGMCHCSQRSQAFPVRLNRAVPTDWSLGQFTNQASANPPIVEGTMAWARVEFPIQLVGRLPHQLWPLPHQLHGLPHQFSIDFGVFQLHNGHVDPVDPKLCHDIIPIFRFPTLKRPVFNLIAHKTSANNTFCPTNFAKEAPPMGMGAVGAAAPRPTILNQWVQTMYSAPTIF